MLNIELDKIIEVLRKLSWCYGSFYPSILYCLPGHAKVVFCLFRHASFWMKNGTPSSHWLLPRRITTQNFSFLESQIMCLLVIPLSQQCAVARPTSMNCCLKISVAAGTVVDNKVCHPKNYDFYMCSHAGMIVRIFCLFSFVNWYLVQFHLCIYIVKKYQFKYSHLMKLLIQISWKLLRYQLKSFCICQSCRW